MKNYSKRAFDVVVASSILLIAVPFIAVVSLIMMVDTGEGPVYKTQRVGKHGKEFVMYKIKTMSNITDEDSSLADENERTSQLAKIIRISRLDELLQLFNVLKGDMRMVGPRPQRSLGEITQNTERQSVKPGITGLGKLAGFNAISYADELSLDLQYIKQQNERSLFQNMIDDLKIIARTPWEIFKNRKAPHYREPSCKL